MLWLDIKKAGFKEISGGRYELTHLQDKVFDWTISATDKHAELKFKALVQFDSHCISKGPPRGSTFNFDVLGHDYKIIDSKGRERCFCPNRHRLSSNLADIFDNFLTRTCRFTNQENYLVLDMVSDKGVTEKYEVFFNLTRQSSNYLRIYVESAFIRDDGSHSPGYKKKIKASTLLAKKLRREAIVRPKGR
jgi:hypothetical protein